MTEIGLVRKWLSDVMKWSKINESRLESTSETALVNLRKLHGALTALGIGYLLGFVALLGEILHWKYVVLRDPRYDKYHLDIFYNNINKSKTWSNIFVFILQCRKSIKKNIYHYARSWVLLYQNIETEYLKRNTKGINIYFLFYCKFHLR